LKKVTVMCALGVLFLFSAAFKNIDVKFGGSLEQRMFSKVSLNFIAPTSSLNPADQKYTESIAKMNISMQRKPLSAFFEYKVNDYWGNTSKTDFLAADMAKYGANQYFIKYAANNLDAEVGRLHYKYGDGLILDTYDRENFGLPGIYAGYYMEPVHFRALAFYNDSFDSAVYGVITGYEDRKNPKNRVNWDVYVFNERVPKYGTSRYFAGLRIDNKAAGTNFKKKSYLEYFKAFGNAAEDKKQKGGAFWAGFVTERKKEKGKSVVALNYGYGGYDKTADADYDINTDFSHFGFGSIFREEQLGKQKLTLGQGLYKNHIINFQYENILDFGLISGFSITHIQRHPSGINSDGSTWLRVLDINNSVGNEFDFYFGFVYNDIRIQGLYGYLLPGSYIGTGSAAKKIEINLKVKL